MKKLLTLLFCFLLIFSCYKKSSNEDITKESVDSEYYHNLFKEYLIKMYSGNNGVNELCANAEIKWKEDGDGLNFYLEDMDGLDLITYDLSDDNPLFKGDLNGDGRDEVIIETYQSGGGCGGNVGWSETYILYGDETEFKEFPTRNRSDFINPTEDNGCPYVSWQFEYFSIHSIQDGFIFGEVQHCIFAPKDAFWKGWDNVYEVRKVKCVLINNKLKIIETIEDQRFEFVPWIETHYKEDLLYCTDEHKILFNGIVYKNYDFGTEPLEWESTYIDGKKIGFRRWHENGQLFKDISYKDGELISGKCWDEERNEIKCE